MDIFYQIPVLCYKNTQLSRCSASVTHLCFYHLVLIIASSEKFDLAVMVSTDVGYFVVSLW